MFVLRQDPSSLAGKFLRFQILRSFSVAALFVSFFLLPAIWSIVFLILFVGGTIGYYLMYHRYLLVIFSLADKVQTVAGGGAEGPAGDG